MKLDLQSNLSEKLESNIVKYRNDFHQFMTMKYFENIISIISYKYNERVVINSHEIEFMLRYHGSCVIGICKDKKYRVLGYATINNDISNIIKFNYLNPTIIFTKPKSLLLDKKQYHELTDYTNGNYVILYNKPFNFNNLTDFQIIEHYVTKLSEIELSRFSIIQQSKFNTVFRQENESDISINKIISAFYNGFPVIKTTKAFDPEDNIMAIGNYQITNALKELKNEYNTTINELNSHFGINSSGIVKESGVSDSEVNSNNDYLTINSFSYLDSRNNKLKLLEKNGVIIEAFENAKTSKAITDLDKFKNTSEVNVE